MKNIFQSNLNEMPFNLSFFIRLKIAWRILFTNFNKYPDPNYPDLTKKISLLEGVEKDEVLVGPGSSALIGLLLMYFYTSGREIVLEEPSYVYYQDFAKSFNIPTKKFEISPSDDFSYNFEMFNNFRDDSVVFFTSPNNPLGVVMPVNLLENLLEKFPNRIFVLDAAYLNFTDEDYNLLFKKFSNLIILKTLSKSALSAALRVGYLIGKPDIVKILKNKITPFSISEVSNIYANVILDKMLKTDYFKKQVIYISKERDLIIKELKKVDWIKVNTNQKTNAVFFEIINHQKGDVFLQKLKDRNVLVKVFENFNNNIAVRYTVTRSNINKIFIDIIKLV